MLKTDITILKQSNSEILDKITTIEANKNLEDVFNAIKTPETSDNENNEQIGENEPEETNEENMINIINGINIQKWHIKVTIKIDDYQITLIALLDIGADLNCIQEGLVPTKYFHKTRERLSSANGSQMHIDYKLPKVYICQNNVCFKTSFVLVKNLTDKIILGTPKAQYSKQTDNNNFKQEINSWLARYLYIIK